MVVHQLKGEIGEGIPVAKVDILANIYKTREGGFKYMGKSEDGTQYMRFNYDHSINGGEASTYYLLASTDADGNYTYHIYK